jgi:hypothetical protein
VGASLLVGDLLDVPHEFFTYGRLTDIEFINALVGRLSNGVEALLAISMLIHSHLGERLEEAEQVEAARLRGFLRHARQIVCSFPTDEADRQVADVPEVVRGGPSRSDLLAALVAMRSNSEIPNWNINQWNTVRCFVDDDLEPNRIAKFFKVAHLHQLTDGRLAFEVVWEPKNAEAQRLLERYRARRNIVI